MWITAAFIECKLADLGLVVARRGLRRTPGDAGLLRQAFRAAVICRDPQMARDCAEALEAIAPAMLIERIPFTADEADWLRARADVCPASTLQAGLNDLASLRYAEAYDVLVKAVRWYATLRCGPLFDAAAEHCCLAIMELGSVIGDAAVAERLEPILATPRVGDEEARWRPLYRGLTRILRGDISEGTAECAEAGLKPTFIATSHHGATSLLSPDELLEFYRSHAGIDLGLPKVEHDKITGREGTALYFCCDPSYFQRYAGLLLGSAGNLGASVRAHAHLVGEATQASEAIKIFARHCPQIDLSISSSMPIFGSRTEYAFSRFLYADQCMALLGCDVIVVDVDLSINLAPQTFAAMLPAADVAIMMEPRALPWFRRPANALLCRQGRGSREFLRLMQCYYKAVARRAAGKVDDSLWFADQNALHVCSLVAEKIGVTSFTKLNAGQGLFSCYGAETRDVFTRNRISQLGLPADLGRWLP